MAALTFAPSAALVSPTRSVAIKKAFSGVKIGAASPRLPCRAARPAVVASAERKQIALPAGVSAGLVAMLSHPLVAEAGVTPSLKNLLNSLIAGGVVLALIVAAVSGVAAFDPVARGRGK